MTQTCKTCEIVTQKNNIIIIKKYHNKIPRCCIRWQALQNPVKRTRSAWPTRKRSVMTKTTKAGRRSSRKTTRTGRVPARHNRPAASCISWGTESCESYVSRRFLLCVSSLLCTTSKIFSKSHTIDKTSGNNMKSKKTKKKIVNNYNYCFS